MDKKLRFQFEISLLVISLKFSLLVVWLEVSLGFHRWIDLILGVLHIWVSIEKVGMIPIVKVESFVVTLTLPIYIG